MKRSYLWKGFINVFVRIKDFLVSKVKLQPLMRVFCLCFGTLFLPSCNVHVWSRNSLVCPRAWLTFVMVYKHPFTDIFLESCKFSQRACSFNNKAWDKKPKQNQVLQTWSTAAFYGCGENFGSFNCSVCVSCSKSVVMRVFPFPFTILVNRCATQWQVQILMLRYECLVYLPSIKI